MARESRKLAVGALVTAAAGIVVQILGGADYPTIPPGVLILLAAAVLFAVRTRWTPLVGLVATLFISIGGVVAPNMRDHLGDPSAVVVFIGTAVQLVGLVAGLVFGVAVVAGSLRTGRPR